MVCPVEPVCCMGQRDSGAGVLRAGWMQLSRKSTDDDESGGTVSLGSGGVQVEMLFLGAPAFQRKLTHSRCAPRPFPGPPAPDEVISDQWRTTTLNGSWWFGPGTSARWLRIVQRQTDQWDLEGQAQPLQPSVPEHTLERNVCHSHINVCGKYGDQKK